MVNKRNSNTSNGDQFSNRLPDIARVQFGNKNRNRNFVVSLFLLLSSILIGAFIIYGRESRITEDSHMLILQSNVLSWSFITFLLAILMIYFTRRVKYEMSLARFVMYLSLISIYTLILLLFKTGVFGDLINNVSTKIFTYINVVFFIVMVLVNFTVNFLSKAQYRAAFMKNILLIIPLLLFIVSPLLIKNMNHDFVYQHEIAFLTVFFLAIFLFAVALGIGYFYLPVGESNLKSINKVYISIHYINFALGLSLGVFASWLAELASMTNIEFGALPIISLVISLLFFGIFMFMLFSNKVKNVNGYFNKLFVSSYMTVSIVLNIILVYFVKKDSNFNSFSESILIVLPSFVLMTLAFLIANYKKIVIFEKWEMISIVCLIGTSIFMMTIDGILYSMNELNIIINWIGKTLVIIVLLVFLLAQIIIIFPAIFLGTLTKVKRKGNNKIKNVKSEKGVKNV